MGFWSVFLGGKPATESSVRIIGEMEISGHSYILSEFYTYFSQDIDGKNCPAGDPRQRIMMIAMESEPDKFLTEWSVSPSQEKEGETHFYSYKDSSSSGALFSVYFKGAKCVSLHRKKTKTGKADSTKIFISPGSIMIGNEEL